VKLHEGLTILLGMLQPKKPISLSVLTAIFQVNICCFNKQRPTQVHLENGR